MYHVDEERCTGCATCVDICREQAICFLNGHAEIRVERCTACGDCAEACPQGAIQWVETAVAVPVQLQLAAQERASAQAKVTNETTSSRMPERVLSRPLALWQSQLRPFLGSVPLWTGRQLLNNALSALTRRLTDEQPHIVNRSVTPEVVSKGRHGRWRHRGGRLWGRTTR